MSDPGDVELKSFSMERNEKYIIPMLLDAEKIDYCKEMMAKAEKMGKQLLLPIDTVIADKFDAEAETKVVPARLHFTRSSGAHIEVFCLEPVSPAEYNLSFAASEKLLESPFGALTRR